MARRRGGRISVVIAGAYTLDAGAIAEHVLLGEAGNEGWGGLSRLPVGSKVLLRHPLEGSPGPLESLIAILCATLEIEVEWRQPLPGTGGVGTIRRDEAMVRDSDAVVTYIDPARHDDTSGTVRLQRIGFQMEKPSWSFSPTTGGVEFVGASEKVLAWG